MKGKKGIVRIILMALFVVMCFALTGCGKELEGTYKFSKLEYNAEGMNVSVKAGEQFMGMMTLTEDYVKVTLNKDGTAEMVMDGETSNGTWSKKDDKSIELTFDDQPVTCKCDGETLVIDDGDGSKITLKK